MLGSAFLALMLVGCASAPPQRADAPAPAGPIEPLVVEPAPAPKPTQEPAFTGPISLANTEREYRRDGAHHLYGRYAERVYPGKLPPLLQAVGVMRVHIGSRGDVRHIEWMRAPDHVPHVKAEIERLVREASPFPAPHQLGSVVYTETWLWDRSGRFQLDTLSEGQLDRSAPRPVVAPKPAPNTRPTTRKTARSRPAVHTRTDARKATDSAAATRVAQDAATAGSSP
ncbi:hypothetical protein [Tepidimonas charontis]|uniref:TonB C-terminal domain-containing protein n=1 Tax=Tepidimonas charontis TaxID=2267262 RepID=A0A554X1I5_9BURK|nr:hypothetical protein [Tepidimonas charontis]TSE29665.1 hypothetical protein Tchar_02555 [Tepidimonas charontis]